ncbi:MAG: outer membrane protein assembly factor BamE [Gammaproteobacteria bacterium]|nr:outer membrane protein assembly factor BamE [Gammaproteobacteria bacterium]
MSLRSFLSYSLLIVSSPLWAADTNNGQTGTAISEEELSQLQPGTTKDQVIEKYGLPTFQCINPGQHNICYFHQSKKNSQTTQEQVEMEFDEQGNLASVKVYQSPNTAAESQKK